MPRTGDLLVTSMSCGRVCLIFLGHLDALHTSGAASVAAHFFWGSRLACWVPSFVGMGDVLRSLHVVVSIDIKGCANRAISFGMARVGGFFVFRGAILRIEVRSLRPSLLARARIVGTVPSRRLSMQSWASCAGNGLRCRSIGAPGVSSSAPGSLGSSMGLRAIQTWRA